MPTPISPMRIARDIDIAVAGAADVERTIDFDLGSEEGIELYRIELIAGGLDFTPSGEGEVGMAYQSLHVEVGTLEDPILADGTMLSSEILARVQYTAFGHEEAAVARMQGLLISPCQSWDFLQMHGRPLLVAQNLTHNIVTESTVSMTDVEVALWYRYVRLTREELVNQFLLRR